MPWDPQTRVPQARVRFRLVLASQFLESFPHASARSASRRPSSACTCRPRRGQTCFSPSLPGSTSTPPATNERAHLDVPRHDRNGGLHRVRRVGVLAGVRGRESTGIRCGARRRVGRAVLRHRQAVQSSKRRQRSGLAESSRSRPLGGDRRVGALSKQLSGKALPGAVVERTHSYLYALALDVPFLLFSTFVSAFFMLTSTSKKSKLFQGHLNKTSSLRATTTTTTTTTSPTKRRKKRRPRSSARSPRSALCLDPRGPPPGLLQRPQSARRNRRRLLDGARRDAHNEVRWVPCVPRRVPSDFHRAIAGHVVDARPDLRLTVVASCALSSLAGLVVLFFTSWSATVGMALMSVAPSVVRPLSVRRSRSSYLRSASRTAFGAFAVFEAIGRSFTSFWVTFATSAAPTGATASYCAGCAPARSARPWGSRDSTRKRGSCRRRRRTVRDVRLRVKRALKACA